MRRGIIVNGHSDAIHTICAWLDRWQQGSAAQAWWPEVIDQDDMRTGSASRLGPRRPSWCYGTPGIARAQQLAAVAVGDPARAQTAVQALHGCLSDDEQLAHLTDAGLCHGWAGLVHTARHAAADANELLATADATATRMRQHLHEHGEPPDEGLLEGTAGTTLVDTARDTATSTGHPRWDTCLLIG
jgi:hypothetical protein